MKNQLPALFVREVNHFVSALSIAKAVRGRFMPVTLALCLSMLTIQSVFGLNGNEVPGPLINRSIVVGPISGTKTIGGVMPNYATLSDAITDINLNGLSGNTTLLIQGNTNEPGPIVINQWLEIGGSNFKLTIKPAPATTPTISANASTAVITINGADRVIIDGSNGSVVNSVCPVSTATRDLTINNSNAGTTSAVVWLQNAGANSATNDTVRNCVLVGNLNTTTLFGLGSGGSTISTTSLGSTNNNNGFINNNISRTQYGIYSQGASTAVKNTGNFITQNVMNTASPNNVAKGGIWTGFENNITISGNTISEIAQTSSPDVFGITLGVGTSMDDFSLGTNDVTNASVTKNVIGNIVNSGTFSAAGISVATATAGTTLIANNMIYGVMANGTEGDFAGGIVLGGGTGSITNVYYNTVTMKGTILGSVAATQTSACLAVVTSTAPTLNSRNNIFTMTQLGNTGATLRFTAVALGYTSTLGNYTGLISDHNDFFVGGPGPGTYTTGITGGVVAGISMQLLTNWTTETGRDGGGTTLTMLPVFLSPGNLHLDIANITNLPLDNGAVSIGAVTDDIDCEVRMTDIGADEIAFVTGIDMRAVTLVVPAAIGCYSASEPVTVSVKNNSLNLIDFSIHNVTVTVTATGGYNNNVVLNSGILAPNASQNVSMPANINMSAPGSYTFNANTSVAGDVNPGNNAMAPVIRTKATLSGTYPLGVGQGGMGGYETLTAAVNAYNNVGCITGPIVFNLIDASFAGAESYPIAINSNPAAGVYTLTIRPASGAVTLSGASPISSIIKLNGADRVIIDGINSGGTSLTINNTSATNASAVIWIGSANASDGATNDTIRNCMITGGSNSTTRAGVFAGSGTTLGNAGEAANSNNAIIGNTIKRAQNGFYSYGIASLDQNWFFSTNSIGSTVAEDKPTLRGLFFANVQNLMVTGNTVTGVISQPASIVSATGIQIFGTVNGGTISNNKLSDIKQINTVGYGSNGIFLTNTSTASALNIFDNFIFDVASYGYPGVTYGDNAYGIMILNGGGYNIYHNTINMNTNQTTTVGLPASINIGSGVITAGSINLRNNIFANNMTVGTQHYCIISGAANTVFSNIDYNDYYTTGGANLGLIGDINGINLPNLALIQAFFGGNFNSENIQPFFVSATDPHINSSLSIALDNQGTPAPIAGVPNDIDGTPWNSPVDMGADEFTGCNLTVSNTNNSGAGSLRDVVGCAFSGASIDASTLPPLSTINLGTEILINKDLTLNGPGIVNLTISGGGASRIFNLGAGKNLTIQNMSLKNGFSPANGGAIYVAGNLTLNNVLLQNNFSGPQPSPWTLIPPGTATVIGNVEVKN